MTKIIKNVYRNDSDTLEGLFRIDNGITLVKGEAKRTDEGYIQGVAPVARTGILKYRLPNGDVRRELVTADNLFNADSMKTLKMKPFTNLHPREVLLDKTTVKRRKIGMTGENVKRDGEHLMVSYVITDKDAIDSVDNGRKQLSPGYKCDLLLEPGNLDGEEYDAIQTNRRYNHLALCDFARGGASLQINVDHCDGLDYEDPDFLNNDSINNNKEKFMPKITLANGLDYEAAAEVINSHKALESKCDSLQGKVDAHTDSMDSVTAERDTLQEKVDSYEKDYPAKVQAAVKARLKLERLAGICLDGKDLEKVDEMSDADLKKSIILKQCPKADLADKSETYLDVRIDGVVESLDEKKTDALNSQRKISAKKQDSKKKDEPSVDKSRTDMVDELENNWKKDLNPAK